jgi:hypothetical protein
MHMRHITIRACLPAQLYNIFPHFLMKGTIFENVLEPKMRTLIFSTTFV